MIHSVTNQQIQVMLYEVKESHYTKLNLTDLSVPYWTISHVLKGEVVTRSGEATSIVKSGQVMIHPPELPFSEHSDREGTHQWMFVDIKLEQYLDLLDYYPLPPVVTLSDPSAYSSTFRRLVDTWRLPPDSRFRDFRATVLTLELLDMLLLSWEKSGEPERAEGLMNGKGRFAQVLRFMTDKMADRLDRGLLAERMHLHPVYFDRIFRETFGMPPMRLLTELRLRRAERLLINSDDTLDAISAACGLGDAAYFSRQFRRKYGLPPGTYRRENRKEIGQYFEPTQPQSNSEA
ncbi:MAG TPA: AraC family transcriptional regulator [Bacilli bacterium]